jgi:hypothetical protein
MNTRRQFLTRLLAAASIPLVARALPQPPIMLPDGGPQPYKGPAIKVPSNRYYVEDVMDIYRNGYRPGINPCYRYVGEWDGTFKLEVGCTNPAWVWLYLCERAYPGRPRRVAAEISQRISCGEVNYRMLYDWGKWADEPLDDPSVLRGKITRSIRMIASTENCHTHADLVALRETLRMYCLQWQSTDPRYRTSYPVS